MAASGAVWVKAQGGKNAGQMIVLPKAAVLALGAHIAESAGLGKVMETNAKWPGAKPVADQQADFGASVLEYYKAGTGPASYTQELESFLASQSPKAQQEAVQQEHKTLADQLLQAMGYVEGATASQAASAQPAVELAEPVTPKKVVSKAVETEPVSQAAVTDAFPESTTYVKTLGGSTGAQLVKGPDGQLYVKKTGNSPAHIEAEYLADRALQALGLDVPAVTMKTGPDGQPYKLARFVPDAQTLGSLPKGTSAREAAEGQLRAGFIGDVLVGDWDVVGMGADNILVGKHGQTGASTTAGRSSSGRRGARRPTAISRTNSSPCGTPSTRPGRCTGTWTGAP